MTIEPLEPSRHDRKTFDCGNEILNNFLRHQAAQQSRKDNSRIYALIDDAKSPERIMGFYTVTMIALDWPKLPEKLAKRHKNAKGSALIARLAVDKHFQGQRHGERLLVDALKRILEASEMVGYPLVLLRHHPTKCIPILRKVPFYGDSIFLK
jgi:GNAT superfamily N-acetyltransferase